MVEIGKKRRRRKRRRERRGETGPGAPGRNGLLRLSNCRKSTKTVENVLPEVELTPS